ncbi:hypothetical protein BVI2075_70057 [Burkholderia vietnamiensis]|nr:hypothetical protein BVI2075_70057 [Burkholderia vietnamiensis]
MLRNAARRAFPARQLMTKPQDLVRRYRLPQR